MNFQQLFLNQARGFKRYLDRVTWNNLFTRLQYQIFNRYRNYF